MTTSTPAKPIALIGVDTFKGQRLLKWLESHDKYKKVIVIDHRPPRFSIKKAKYYKIDLTEALADVSLAQIFKREKIHTVINAKLPIDPFHNTSLGHELIAIGSYYIFNACDAARIKKVILCTSTDVYGAMPTNPNYLTEQHEPQGHRQSRFLGDKLDAEKQALKFQAKDPRRIVTIARNCSMLGPNINSYKTRYFSKPVVTTILGFDPLVQFIHQNDVIDALQLFVEQDHSGIFNIASDGVLPLSRVIQILGKLHIRAPQIGIRNFVQTLWNLDLSPAPAAHIDFLRYLCVVDNGKIKKALGWQPRYTTKDALLSFVGTDRLRQVNLLEA